MKKLIVLLFVLSVISCKNTATKQKENTNKNLGENRIEVLDFYGKHRCVSCLNIERNTKSTLKKYFQKEMDNGTITFKMVQWDDPKNDALVNKYQAAGTSLIIHTIVNGKETIKDISDFAFKKSDKDAIFETELVKKINNALALVK